MREGLSNGTIPVDQQPSSNGSAGLVVGGAVVASKGTIRGDQQPLSNGSAGNSSACCWSDLRRSTAVVKWLRLWLGRFEEIHSCRQMVPLVVVVGTI